MHLEGPGHADGSQCWTTGTYWGLNEVQTCIDTWKNQAADQGARKDRTKANGHHRPLGEAQSSPVRNEITYNIDIREDI
jgi:hypothetical protein